MTERTTEDKVIRQKIRYCHTLNREVVIIANNLYFKKYSELLVNLNVRVITPNQLTRLLDGKLGRVRTP